MPALEEADESLRDVYRELADNPDLAPAREGDIARLTRLRRELALEVGLTLVAERHREKREAVLAAAAPALPGSDVKVDEFDVKDAPAEEQREPAEVAPRPVSEEVIGAWREQAQASALGTAASYSDRSPVHWGTLLDELIGCVGCPRELELELDDELAALDACGREPIIGKWALLPREVQQTWLGMIVARTRAAKDLMGLSTSQRALVKTIISRYPPWALEHHPGHVNGLQLQHRPLLGSWTEDARHLWSQLDAMSSGAPLSSRRNPVQTNKRRQPRPDGETDSDESAIDPSWEQWPCVRQKRGVLVGGDPREPNRARLQQVFELASLEWPELGPRRLAPLVERIHRGNLDLAIVLQPFVSHGEANAVIDAAKTAGVMWIMAQGYGVTQVKLALERFAAPAAPPLVTVADR